MLPPVDPNNGNLPPGIHDATWSEFVGRYGYNPRRLTLLAGLKEALDALRAAGCRRAYIDGSFVTAKEQPNDFDGCWEPAKVDPALLDPVLLDLRPPRAGQKARFGSELFPAGSRLDHLGTQAIDFFQRDWHTGKMKGIVAINLGGIL